MPTAPASTVSPVPLSPPKTPETVAGAEQVTRAYFAALNEVEARADLAGARLLPDYVLATCQLCTQFNRNLLSDAVRARKLGGRSLGGQFKVVGVQVRINAEFPSEAIGSLRFSVSAAALLDARGQVVDRGPGGTLTTYRLHVSFEDRQWRVSNLQQVP